jgi:hypothetical protein
MDEQQHPQDSRLHTPGTERQPAYDEHDLGYEAAMPMLQGGLAAAGMSWRDSL